jgi:hypothetical protein
MSAQIIRLADYRSLRHPVAPARPRTWLERVSCSACGQHGHTRARCTDHAALRRADEIKERRREARRTGDIVCGLCHHAGHDRSWCPERRWP